MDQLTQTATANLNIYSWEVILIFFLIGGAFLMGLLLGRNKVFTLLLGCYISFGLMSVIPLDKLLPSMFEKEEDFVLLVVVFLVLIGLSYFLLSRSILKTTTKSRGDRAIFQSFFLGLFLIGAVISVVFSFFPEDLLSEFSEVVLKIFNSNLARVIWLVVPLLFLGLVRKKKRRR